MPFATVSLVSDTCAAALSNPLPVSSFWHLQVRFSVCTTLGLAPALTRMVIARSHAQRRDWRQPRCAKPSNCAAHAHARQLLWARTRASQPSGRTPEIDFVRLIVRYPPARLPTQSTS
jgi:hypothetical protein